MRTYVSTPTLYRHFYIPVTQNDAEYIGVPIYLPHRIK